MVFAKGRTRNPISLNREKKAKMVVDNPLHENPPTLAKGIGEHIHWYVTDKCNLDCGYCFKPHFPYVEKEELNIALAHILAGSGIKKVTIGGGEPSLEKNLAEIVSILKDGGKYVSIHTNGLLLDDRFIGEIRADDIGLPIDSTNRKIQKELRGERFLEVFDRLPELAFRIAEKGIKLGYHTVFTAINQKGIPAIYGLIRKHDFMYWRIYEFNDDLALGSALDAGHGQNRFAGELSRIELFGGKGTPSKGYADCLLADFLLMEKWMKTHNDARIQFVGRRYSSMPYAFLDSRGDVSAYSWLSGRERRVIGNIIIDGMALIIKRLHDIHEKGMEFDDKTEEEFWYATVGDMPLWARLWDGSFSSEETEAVNPRFSRKLRELSKLHEMKVLERSNACID
jgi:MoaA/NifB/PqqE/SkfB family radical SAM enzyme